MLWLEEAEVDVTLCGKDGASLGDWAVYKGAVFQHDVPKNWWVNRDELSFVPHFAANLHSIRLTAEHLDTVVPLGQVYYCALGMTLTMTKEAIKIPGDLAAGLELQLTTNALKTNQEFEKLRRRLKGAVKKGKLWLES